MYREIVGSVCVNAPNGQPIRAYLDGCFRTIVRPGVGTFNLTMEPRFQRPEGQVRAQHYGSGGGTVIVQSFQAGVAPDGLTILANPVMIAGVLAGMTVRLRPGFGNQQDRIIQSINAGRNIITPTVAVANPASYESVTAQILSVSGSPGISVLDPGDGTLQILTFSDIAGLTLGDLSFDLFLFRGPPTGGSFPLIV